ncbi:hypothetical protein LO762_04130 [Actinocorallia sp. API 0066]|uniref:hypothetical protein n=1 Tax=Actinocorallia sp. API 0066 TaxID=2896846 RepID=UPI001E50DB65|nr:hypothetical protein [Actinocorallia sp. API 0066]MCD0448387.1 hypothetical protein [Actinocorallia sp. API 0066]
MSTRPRFVIIAAAIALLAPLVATPAAAAPMTYGRSYSASVQQYSFGLKRCIRISISGNVTFKIRSHGKSGKFYYDVRLVEPTMRVRGLTKCTKGKATKLSGMHMQQNWYETKCDLKADASVSFPWTIGTAVTVECGSRKVLRLTSTDMTKRKVYTQFAESHVAAFTGRATYVAYPGKTRPLCLATHVRTTAYLKGANDAFDPRIKICVKR